MHDLRQAGDCRYCATNGWLRLIDKWLNTSVLERFVTVVDLGQGTQIDLHGRSLPTHSRSSTDLLNGPTTEAHLVQSEYRGTVSRHEIGTACCVQSTTRFRRLLGMDRTASSIVVNGEVLEPRSVEDVARRRSRVHLADSARERIDRSRSLLESSLASGGIYYGVNTGFGALSKVEIDPDSLKVLQTNLIRSHATGVGDSLDTETVRAMMLVLVASLARGHSGVRVELVESLVALLNQEITPEIPEIGSVGASGDLAPLAHLALVLIGEGTARYRGQLLSGGEALAKAGLSPVSLAAKEGLALINGTHLMAARAALLLQDFERLFDAALVAAAMSIDCCRTTPATLDPRLQDTRGQAGQAQVAARLRGLLDGSEIATSHVENDPRVQDPYSFRCCSAVLGSSWDAFTYVRKCVVAELGAVTDNPLVFSRGNDADIVAGGNFHGMPIALPLDVLAIALSHLAGVAERRVFHMLSGQDSEAELPTFLTPQAGLQSGLMIAQYTAAACCNELIGLANPASVANLSTSAGMEDYNSYGPRGAAKAVRGVALARSVVAIELLCAATGLDHHRPLRSGKLVEEAFARIRERVAPLDSDRSPAPDIRALEEMIDADDLSLTE